MCTRSGFHIAAEYPLHVNFDRHFECASISVAVVSMNEAQIPNIISSQHLSQLISITPPRRRALIALPRGS
jgi:hypothetical protein